MTEEDVDKKENNSGMNDDGNNRGFTNKFDFKI